MRGWRLPVLAAALLAVSCVEPTGLEEERFGQVRLRPAFASGESEASLRVTVDSVLVTITRAGRALAVVESRTAFTRDQALGWVLELEAEEESLPAQVELRGGGALLYSGEATLHAAAGRVANVGVRDIMVTYVGDPRAMSVAVTPGTVALDALSATAPLVATAYDAAGAPLAGKTFAWSSSAPDVATVDAAGTVTAVRDGVAEISATVDSLTAIAQVTVAVRAAPGTSTISAEPTAVRADGIEASLIRVRLFDGNGNPLTASGGTVALTTTLGTLSSVTDLADGTYLATLVSGTVGSARVEGTLDGVALGDDATVEFTPLPIIITTIIVSPPTATLTALGATQPFAAEARQADGTPVAGVVFGWTSGGIMVATVDPLTGLATAVGEGTTTIRATAAGVTGSATLTVSPVAAPGRSTLEAAPGTLPADGATASTLRVRLLDANDSPLGTSGGVVTLATTLGALSVVADQGDGTYTATLVSAIAGTATVSGTIEGAPLGNDVMVEFTPVLPRVIASISVTPAAATLTALDATQQFTALALDASGAVIPGVTFLWNTTTAGTASIGASSGLATAVANDVTAVTATAEGVVGSAALTVAQRASLALSMITAVPTTLPADGTSASTITVQLVDANGYALTRSDGTVILSSTLGTLSAVTDLADGTYRATLTSAASGLATVTGTLDGAVLLDDATVEFAPPPVVTTIVVSPAIATLTALGATQLFTAEAREADGTPIPGIEFTWTSTDIAVAAVDQMTGLATAVREDVTTISATALGVTGTATLTVEQEVSLALSTITAAPPAAPADGTSASTITVQLVDANGYALTRSDGTVILSSTLGTLSAVTDLADGTYRATLTSAASGLATVTGTLDGAVLLDDATVEFAPLPPVVATIAVTPATATLTALGATQQFTAEAREADDTPIPGVEFAWTSTDIAVATVDPVTGLATAHQNGTTSITATAAGVSGAATLTVEQQAAAVVVTPPAATLFALGATTQLAALVVDAGGSPLPDQSVLWTSGAIGIATVSATGEVSAVANGSTVISAAVTGAPAIAGSSTITVSQRAATITLTKECPAAALQSTGAGASVISEVPLISCDTLTAIGDQVQVVATVRDSLGNLIVEPVITWMSSETSVASVDETGLVSASGNGTTGITASVGEVTAEIEVVVRQVVTSITISPEELTLDGVGSQGALLGTARDRNGFTVEDADISWGVSSNPEVVAVSSTGVVTALSLGSAVVKAWSGGAHAYASATVR